MLSADAARVEQLPEEIMFSITRAPSASAQTQNVARLGLLRLPNRNPVQTPHYVGVASRGVVPHLSPDNFAKQTDIRGIYTALEDCKDIIRLGRGGHIASNCADSSAYMKT